MALRAGIEIGDAGDRLVEGGDGAQRIVAMQRPPQPGQDVAHVGNTARRIAQQGADGHEFALGLGGQFTQAALDRLETGRVQ